MENHPIPQDITGFQFKLIGNMTVRQFVYLAVGAFFAWLFFFILKPPTLIKWPLSLFFLGIGAAFAFIPVDGRPMDVMLGNFIKALISPTQFIYQKGSASYSSSVPDPKTQMSSLASAQQQIPPAQIPQVPAANSSPSPVVELTTPQIISAPAAATADPTQIPQTIIDELNKPPEKPKEEKNDEEKESLQKQVEELKKQLEASQTNQPPAPPPLPQPEKIEDHANLQNMLAESTRQKEALEKQILEMRAKAESDQKQAFTPTVAKPLASTQRVRNVPLGMEKTVGIPSVPEAPNLITGIIKDPRGNPIANILVEIKDQDQNAVRAFKTNALGKFASATSLSNGKYIISFEDPGEKNKFDTVALELVGTSVMPLEIISVDPREELRRELFN